MKKTLKKSMIVFLAVVTVNSFFLACQVEALSTEEIENQPIYQNGFEDRYLFETTDSVIITKTGLNRTKPEVFGKYEREEYPIPNISQTKSEEKFNLIKEENIEIMAKVEQDIAKGTLKKHIAADGQFYGTVSEEAKAVEKVIYVNSNLKGSHSLAVYIPAGEIATVSIPEEFLYLAEQGKMKIRVGLAETNADKYSKNNGKENRMPRLGKEFVPTENNTKVGTPFGGMVYIFITTEVPDGLTIPITITGAVDTPYYDLGATTKQEWEQARKAPGLYTEFRTPFMRFMLPSEVVRDMEDPYNVLSFWLNVASLSTYPFGAQGRTLPITMVFDPYVAAGAAYATVGAWICNLPTGWAKSSLNYESIMKAGCWGTIHEFNHHWQGTYNSTGRWGVGEVGEVTNNVMNAASYILYTNIAATRTTSGLKDWNIVSDPYCNLKNVMNSSKNQETPVTTVFMYASFMHEFGVQNYLEVIKSNYSGGTYHGIELAKYNSNETRYDDLAYRTSVVMGKDLSYYFEQVLHFPLKTETIQKIKKLGFESYLPVQNLYSAGVNGIETGRPFYIPNGDYIFDFDQFMISPGKVEIIEVGKPNYGAMVRRADGTYLYTPKKDLPENTIDQFTLTVKVTADGISQTRTLLCKIGLQYQLSKIEKYEINQDNTEQAIALSETMDPYQTNYQIGVNYTTDNGYNLTKGSGYFIVPESGEYEFQAYGDDKIKFILTAEGKEFVSTTNTYTAGVSNAYSNSNCTHFTVSLKKDTPYAYVLYANNRGGAGAGKVAFRKTNSEANFENLPNSYSQLEDVGKQTDQSFPLTKTPYYTRALRKVGDKITLDLSQAKVLKTPAKQNSEGNESTSILDGDRNTFFHSRYSGGGITAFPHEYIVDLGEEKSFNQIEIYTRSNNTNGTIGDYEIYVAQEYQDEQTKWTLLTSEQDRKGNEKASTTISKEIPETKARYLMVKALNNKNGNNFTIISEIELSIKTKINQILPQNSSQLLYQGNWERRKDGNYINGATYHTVNGKMAYGFEGTQTAIYSSRDAVIRVKIDQKEEIYSIKGSKYTPSLILKGYSQGKHMVEIQVISGEFDFNLVTTDGNFIPYEKEQMEEELTISSSVYQIKEKILLKILPNTTVQEFKKNIQTNAKSIRILNSEGKPTDGIIATGMKLDLDEKIQYTLIIVGDLNKDGNRDIVDLSILNKKIMGIRSLDQEQLLASDLNFDEESDIVDLSILNKMVLGIRN